MNEVKEMGKIYAQKIVDFYKEYNINITVSNIIESYSITRYFLELDRSNKTRIANVEKLVDDLSVSLGVKNIKFTLDFETGGIVLEIPKKDRKILEYSNINQTVDNSAGLQVCFGKDLNNNNFMVDLCKTPHLLVAGTTGSGKSVFINTVLLNLIQKYDESMLKISLIDPKKVELSLYKNEKHTEAFADELQKAKQILVNALDVIDRRYKKLQDNNVRSIDSYNNKVDELERMPYKLIVIDELADIILQDNKNMNNRLYVHEHPDELSLESLIVRIAQIGRACGVHLIVATQRPSSDIITGLIKANIPSRVAFSVSGRIDSRIILDVHGAEKLTGKGDMLVKLVGDEELHRVQGAFVSDEEVERIVELYKKENVEIYVDTTEDEKDVQEVLDTITLNNTSKNDNKKSEQDELKRQQKIKMALQVIKIIVLCLLAVVFIPITIILAVISGASKHYK